MPLACGMASCNCALRSGFAALAGVIGGLCAWLILEPYIQDKPRAAGQVDRSVPVLRCEKVSMTGLKAGETIYNREMQMYDRDQKDIFLIQSDVAQQIANKAIVMFRNRKSIMRKATS